MAGPVAAGLQIGSNFARKVVGQRHLIWSFATRDLRSRYVGSLIGLFWSIIHPLALFVSYYFVFQIVLGAGDSGDYTENFAIFVFAGLLPWLLFQDTLLRGTVSVVENTALIKKTVFPSEIFPLALVLSNLVVHFLTLVVFLVVILFVGEGGWAILLVPLYAFLLAVFSVGLAWLGAVLQVFLRDTFQVLSVVTLFWFWVTPILYPVSRVPDWLRLLVEVNPLTHFIEAYRALLLGGRVPDLRESLLLVGFSAVAFLIGGYVFRSSKREFVDVL